MAANILIDILALWTNSYNIMYLSAQESKSNVTLITFSDHYHCFGLCVVCLMFERCMQCSLCISGPTVAMPYK